MLTFEIKANGRVIGFGSAVNVEKLDGDERKYNWEFYEPLGQLRKGVVTHDRKDGALSLVQKIVSTIEVRKRTLKKKLLDRPLYSDGDVEGFIEGGNVTIRTVNTLEPLLEGLTVRDLISMTEKKFRKLRNVGPRVVKDVKEWLAENELSFKEEK